MVSTASAVPQFHNVVIACKKLENTYVDSDSQRRVDCTLHVSWDTELMKYLVMICAQAFPVSSFDLVVNF